MKTCPWTIFDVWFWRCWPNLLSDRPKSIFKSYADRYPHSTRAYGAAGADFIEQAARSGKPFCLTLFFKAPHRPVTPDPTLDAVYQGTRFRKLPNHGRPAGNIWRLSTGWGANIHAMSSGATMLRKPTKRPCGCIISRSMGLMWQWA